MPEEIGRSPLKLSTQLGLFSGHIFFGTFAFIILACPAVILSMMASYLRSATGVEFIVSVLVGLHYLLFGLDVVVFVAYIFVQLYAAAIELIRYVKSLS
jgi:hypothetical protein